MAFEPIPGQPGLFRDSEGDPNQIFNIRDFREGDKYDTIAIPTGSIVAGTEFLFFQEVSNKRMTDTNFRTQSKLSAGESMVLDRIGLYVRSSTGLAFPAPQDVKTIMDNAFYRLEINGLLQDEGPAIKFPSGYGLYGQTNENGQGIVSVGVPATASASRLLKKQLLNQNHELMGRLRFDDRPWLVQGTNPPFASAAGIVPAITTQAATQPATNAAVLVVNFLHGLIRAAVSK
ncbi:MAG: hypothetical protein ACRCSL_04765 [Microbacterium sp.]